MLQKETLRFGDVLQWVVQSQRTKSCILQSRDLLEVLKGLPCVIKQIHLYIYEYPNVSRLHGDCNILPETSSGGFSEELVRPK